MMARRTLMGLLAVATVLSIPGCKDGEHWDGGKFYTPFRFALKAEVETPEGVKIGQSVIEVKKDVGGYFKARGEAVAVNLPGGETLFVLLRSKANVDWLGEVPKFVPEDVRQSFAPDYEKDPAGYWLNFSRYRGTVAVPREQDLPFGRNEKVDTYPYFVRFINIADPKSVEQVNPDDLAKTYGAGYRLRSLTLTFTGNDVTTGIEKRLPSYGKETGYDDWYKTLPYGDGRAIQRTDFVRGAEK